MEMFDLDEFDVLAHASGGEIEPLAKHIERGGALGPDLRRWLADHLRGKHPKKRGNKRLWSQVEREMRVVGLVRSIQHYQGKTILELRKRINAGMSLDEIDDAELFAATRGSISENAAVELYLEVDATMNRETLRTYLRKEKDRRRKGCW